jgi:hypothetical protein
MTANPMPDPYSVQANDPDPYLQHDRWTRQQLEDYQACALQACREYAYAHSPFYQRFHRGLIDRPLHELPVLTKAMLMEHFDELITDRTVRLENVRHYMADSGGQERFLNRYRVMATSGSTGQPGVFLANQAERANLAVGFSRFPAWAGVPPATKFAMVASTASGHMTSQIPAMVNGQLLPRLQLSASDPLEQLVRQLNEWQPGMVAGYPSILGVLAKEQQQGRLQISPDFIASGSEVLTDETRRCIEQAWHTQLFNIYAATESGVLASECRSHSGLHLYEDLLIVEVVDERNRPVPPGVYGNFGIVTDFKFQLHPVGPLLVGVVAYPLDKAREAFRLYREFTRTAPDALTTTAGFVALPGGPPAVAITFCYCGPLEEGERLVEPSRTFGSPIFNQLLPMTYHELISFVDAANPAGRHYYSKTRSFQRLSDELIETLIEYSQNRTSPFSQMMFQHVHGAVCRVDTAETAFALRGEHYALHLTAAWEDGEASPHITWLRSCWTALEPFATHEAYLNFMDDPGEVPTLVQNAYGTNYKRLVAIKNRYDPGNFFHINQNIKPTVQR